MCICCLLIWVWSIAINGIISLMLYATYAHTFPDYLMLGSLFSLYMLCMCIYYLLMGLLESHKGYHSLFCMKCFKSDLLYCDNAIIPMHMLQQIHAHIFLCVCSYAQLWYFYHYPCLCTCYVSVAYCMRCCHILLAPLYMLSILNCTACRSPYIRIQCASVILLLACHSPCDVSLMHLQICHCYAPLR